MDFESKYHKTPSNSRLVQVGGFFAFMISLLFCHTNVSAADQESNYSAIEVNRGAYLFGRYCTLCHGNDGLGEGVLTIRIDDYPSTNLIAGEQRFKSLEQLVDVITDGGVNESLAVSESMPPYQEEISDSDIEYLAKFIMFLREDNEPATEILKGNIALLPLRRDAGRELFKIHCVLCHGKQALGNGRMAKIFKLKKAASPANLTLSVLPQSALFNMIALGGEANGRSPYMPPWEQQLSKRQINAVVEYIQSLNIKSNQASE